MTDFILHDNNMPFAAALVIMLVIAFMEGAFVIVGSGLSQMLDGLIIDAFGDTDLDIDLDIDIDADIDADINADMSGLDGAAESASLLVQFLGWLCVGKVPLLILLVVFLTVFGIAGYVLQYFSHDFDGRLLPAWFACIPALAVALPATRWFGIGFSKIIPKDETQAVSRSSFIGLQATITLGTAEHGSAAQAKLKDKYGQSHYVMVEPVSPDNRFEQGQTVIIKQKQKSHFLADPVL